jgi:hypothetical protein
LGQQPGDLPGQTDEKVNAMSGSTLAIILIPIVVAAGLVVWISMVFHADRHRTGWAGSALPTARSAEESSRETTGR